MQFQVFGVKISKCYYIDDPKVDDAIIHLSDSLYLRFYGAAYDAKNLTIYSKLLLWFNYIAALSHKGNISNNPVNY